MNQCKTCKDKDIYATTWDKVKTWLLFHLFGEQINDEKANSYTQGIAQGYNLGRQHQYETDLAYEKVLRGDDRQAKESIKDMFDEQVDL